MTDAILFSFTNVGIGFIVSFLLSHYLLPILFGVPRSGTRAFNITMIYTVVAIIRNIIIYGVWV